MHHTTLQNHGLYGVLVVPPQQFAWA